jgi:ABC-type nitrate/sulfonate/bicarbonate transport system substrate-binding protein
MLNTICFVPPAILTVAEKRGILAARGVETRVVLTSSSDEQFQALVEQRCDVAVTAMDNVIGWNRRDSGWDFRIVAQVEATTPLSLFVRAEITSFQMLVGRTILVDSPENGFVVALHAMLADAGIDLRANRIIAAGGVKERLAKLQAGAGDATLLGPPFDELARAAGLHRLASVNELYPTFPGQGVVVRQSTLATREALMTRWLQGLEAGRMQCRVDPYAARADLVSGGLPLSAAHALIAGVGETLVPDRSGVELLISQRARLGRPGVGLRYNDIVDTRLLKI